MLKRWIQKLFATTEVDTAHEPPQRVRTEDAAAPIPFNYGLDMLNIALRGGDYGWTEPVQLPKKYVLVDLEAYREKVNVFGLVSAWRQTGHSEWEYLMAGYFISHLLKAYEVGVNETEITGLFDRDYLASGDRVFTKEQVITHVMPSFTKVNEDEENVYLRLNVAA
jgi:hypothetical protein